MPRHENFNPLLIAATVLAISILVAFQLYQVQEPARMEADAAQDLAISILTGDELYEANCANCHGLKGEGSTGPALRTKELLENVSEELLIGLVKTGIPGSSMPAWSQAYDGPFTDEEVRHVIAYIKSWAPLETTTATPEPDLARGAEIFVANCSACHGHDGLGTEIASAVNDPELLNNFDDDWFRDTIIQGRASRGMPAWGAVLSTVQIEDLIALLAAWRQDASAGPPTEETRAESDRSTILFATNCAPCHGPQGEGGIGPSLRPNDFVINQTDEVLIGYILSGDPGTSMPAFEGRLPLGDVQSIAALLREWQP